MRIPGPGEVFDYGRHLGIRRALSRGAYVSANKLMALSILECVQLRLEDVNTALIDAAGRYECRFLAADEIRRFGGELSPNGERVASEAVARGDACYAVIDGGKPASVSFYSPHPTPVLNDLVVGFDPACWCMYGGYTSPPFRGRRLHALGVLSGAIELFDRGVPALVGIYERTNYRSMLSALRMGWKPCGTLLRIGIGPWMRLSRNAEARTAGIYLERRRIGRIP
jgi:hypothetical protein